MEFLRMHGIPVPKILDWNSSASNQLGSEYIIMERVSGRELADTWHTMAFKERMAVVEKIVDIERLLFGIQFPASGSLFFLKIPWIRMSRAWIFPKITASKIWATSALDPRPSISDGIKSEMSSVPIVDLVSAPICMILS